MRLTDPRKRAFKGFVAGVICTAAFGLAACGGDSEPSKDVTADIASVNALAAEMQAAIQAKDSGKVCRMLDPAVLSRQFKGVPACKRSLNAQLRQSGTVPDVSLEEVLVEGDYARGMGSQTDLFFRQVGGKWYISEDVPGKTPESPADS